MSDSIILSVNMSLPIPVVGVDLGPDYALNIDSCLAILDQHDHSNGSGVPITPTGLNINTDIPFLNNSATQVFSIDFNSQPSALTGTNFISMIGGNLYVNDGSGNQIPITSAGGVAGSPGSIGSLTAPAAATYNSGSKTFSWTSGSSKAAAMDGGAITIRETDVASAPGITIASPSPLTTDYELILPLALPLTGIEVLTLSTSGNLASITYDDIGEDMSSIGANAIAATMTSAGANAIENSRTSSTGTTAGLGGIAVSASSGSAQTSSLIFQTVLTCTLTTAGRSVSLMCQPDGGTLPAELGATTSGSGQPGAQFRWLRGSTPIGVIGVYGTGSSTGSAFLPGPGGLNMKDINPAAGTYTYSLQFLNDSTGGGTQEATAHNVVITAEES